MRTYRMLRQLTEPACNGALSFNEASSHRELRAGRNVVLQLRYGGVRRGSAPCGAPLAPARSVRSWTARARSRRLGIKAQLMQLLALVFAVLSGFVHDQTTGQPLVGVSIQIDGKHAVTDRDGRYVLKNVHTGIHTLLIGSKDVPSQRFDVTVKAPSTRFDLHACSTTLDYSCSGPPAGLQNG